MKKILATLSLICFVAFISNAQTTPSASSTTATSKEVKTEAVATTPVTKKAACCHKGMSSGNCKGKSAKSCTKGASDSKAQKSSTTGSNN